MMKYDDMRETGLAKKPKERAMGKTTPNALCPFHEDDNPSMTLYMRELENNKDPVDSGYCFACGQYASIPEIVERHVQNLEKKGIYMNPGPRAEESGPERETEAEKLWRKAAKKSAAYKRIERFEEFEAERLGPEYPVRLLPFLRYRSLDWLGEPDPPFTGDGLIFRLGELLILASINRGNGPKYVNRGVLKPYKPLNYVEGGDFNVVEGIFDAAALLKENYRNVVCTAGTGNTGLAVDIIKEWSLKTKTLICVRLMGDGDEAGRRFNNAIARELREEIPEAYILKSEFPDGEDVDSILRRDPDAFKNYFSSSIDEDILEVIKYDNKENRRDMIVMHTQRAWASFTPRVKDEMSRKLYDSVNNIIEEKHFARTYIQDRYFKFEYKGEPDLGVRYFNRTAAGCGSDYVPFIAISAPPGTGKSLTVMSYGIELVLKDKDNIVSIAPYDEGFYVTHSGTYRAILSGMFGRNWDEAINFRSRFGIIREEFSPKVAIKMLRKMDPEKKIHFIIDYFGTIPDLGEAGGYNIYEAQKEYMRDLRSLAKDYYVTLHLLGHPAKKQKFGAPEGTGGWAQSADFGFGIGRLSDLALIKPTAEASRLFNEAKLRILAHNLDLRFFYHWKSRGGGHECKRLAIFEDDIRFPEIDGRRVLPCQWVFVIEGVVAGEQYTSKVLCDLDGCSLSGKPITLPERIDSRKLGQVKELLESLLNMGAIY